MGSNEVERDTAQDRVVIGSADLCDVPVDEPKVSRRHCAVTKTTAGFVIEDLNSRNGTYVDGKRIDRKATVPARATVTLSRSVPFPWDEVLAFFEGRNGAGKRPPRIVTIGRLPGTDLVLDDPAVSGRHARVVYEAGEVFIEDLGSRNGTHIVGNDAPVARALLRRNDVIVLGDTRVPAHFFFGDEAPQRPAAPDGDQGVLKTVLGDSPSVPHEALDLSGRQGVFVLGRAPSCDFQLDYPMVSLRHAELRVSRGKASITDLGSSNGTFVNGIRVARPTPLEPGDMVALGSVWFVLSQDGLSLAPKAARGDITIEAREVGVTVSNGKPILA